MPRLDGTGPLGRGPLIGRGLGLGRPRNPRCLKFNPSVYYFKPQGIPMIQLEEVILLPDELETIKLYGVDGLDQTEAAKEMAISQPTFARLLGSANKKIADAIISGKAIRIEENIKPKG